MDALSQGRLLCDTLRVTAADDGERARLATMWRDADRGALVALAMHEGAELWLQRRLKPLGIGLGDTAHATLDAAARRTRAGTMRADAALAHVTAIFAAAEVEVIPLKSAAMRRLTGRLPLADARGAADVDLLVREVEADRACAVLREHHFVPLVSETARPVNHHHRAPMADQSGTAVELHVTTHATVVPREAWRRATMQPQLAEVDGHRVQLPGDTELLWHALAHASRDATEEARLGLRLRYWLDGAVLVAGGTIDWTVIRERLDGSELESPELGRAWLWWAAVLGGRALGLDEIGTGEIRALDLPRLLAWRLRVLGEHPPESRWREKLLEEGARVEAGVPGRPGGEGSSLYAAARHAIATQAARARYALWRAGLHRRDGPSSGRPSVPAT